jgi:uncharacterized protein YegP (UPF0339 family)
MTDAYRFEQCSNRDSSFRFVLCLENQEVVIDGARE